jgi:aconitate decarboxylase
MLASNDTNDPTTTSTNNSPTPTRDLTTWISTLTLPSIPPSVVTRAKYLLLDGIACLLVGAQLPSSRKAVRALLDLEPPTQSGTSQIYGWGPNTKTSPLQAALLNSTFIQGFELDDYHSEAPLHSNSLVIPAILAAAEGCRGSTSSFSSSSTNINTKNDAKVSGADLLLALIAGYEVGPRVGLALHGTHMLTCGWHSGAVFGPSAAAAASSKLLGLSAEQIEDALGIACTQAGGLMSAQFDSDVKRMQHGFAARNGLLGTVLARGGYTGIKRVYEWEYGGFLSAFSAGNGMQPPYVLDEISKGLGEKWQLEGINVKAYSAMAGTHATVDCMRELQERHPDELRDLEQVEAITIELGEAMFHHGGWQAERPVTATGAQMNNAYVGATQLVDGVVLPPQFRDDALDRDEVWALVRKIKCVLNNDLGGKFATRVTLKLSGDDGKTLTAFVPGPKGIVPPFSNEGIVSKWRELAAPVIDADRIRAIEGMVLNIDECEDISRLTELLAGTTRNPLDGA